MLLFEQRGGPGDDQRANLCLDLLLARVDELRLQNGLELLHEERRLAYELYILLIDGAEVRVRNAVGRREEVREAQPGRLRDLLKIMTQKKQLELLLGLSSTAPALPETIAHHFENFLKNKLVILLRSQWTRLLIIDDLLQLFGKGE